MSLYKHTDITITPPITSIQKRKYSSPHRATNGQTNEPQTHPTHVQPANCECVCLSHHVQSVRGATTSRRSATCSCISPTGRCRGVGWKNSEMPLRSHSRRASSRRSSPLLRKNLLKECQVWKRKGEKRIGEWFILIVCLFVCLFV